MRKQPLLIMVRENVIPNNNVETAEAKKIREFLANKGINLGDRTPKNKIELEAYLADLERSVLQQRKELEALLNPASTDQQDAKIDNPIAEDTAGEAVVQENTNTVDESALVDTDTHQAPVNETSTMPRGKFLKFLGIGAVAAAAGAYGISELLDDSSDKKTSKNNPGHTKDAKTQPSESTSADIHPINQKGMEQFSIEMRQRMETIIANARDTLSKIASGESPEIALANPYVVSVLYYSDEYVYHKAHDSLTPQSIIVREISPYVTKDVRKKYIEYLGKRFYDAQIADIAGTKPLKVFSFGAGENHHDALDLFTHEGNPVNAMERGIVVLAESSWTKDDSLSTSSMKGGNTVIMYNPDKNYFYRYAHLEQVKVKPGDAITAGATIGTVGHTGINASQPGHGQHLHIEINAYSSDTATVKSMTDDQLRTILR